MKITWLGHSGFRIQIEHAVLLVDPWLEGNPSFPEDRRAEATDGATHILLTHGHGDHSADVQSISADLGIPIVGIFELSKLWPDADLMPMNKGGTVDVGGARVTMVNATHSSSFETDDGIQYAGNESGFMIAGEGHTIYVSGDTDIMADMDWMGDYHKPDIGILACGGTLTMDMDRAAYAAKRYFNFDTVIPCHFGTFDMLAQSVGPLVEKLPSVDVKTPQVLEPMEFPAR